MRDLSDGEVPNPWIAGGGTIHWPDGFGNPTQLDFLSEKYAEYEVYRAGFQNLSQLKRNVTSATRKSSEEIHYTV